MDDGLNRIWCKICGISLNSKAQADQHYVGRVHLNKLKAKGIMDSSDQNNASNNNSSSAGLSYCSVCSVSLEPHTSSEHFESRTHLNRCLQKGVGISLVPGSTGIKEGERSSTWCSICNHALESVTQAEEHYESRAHLNKCLQRGVGIPLTYAAASPPCVALPAGPRFSQAGGGATSPGISQFPPPGAGGGGGSGFRQGITGGAQFKPRPRLPFAPNSRPTFGAKKFPIQPFVRGPTQSNARMSGQYSGGGSGSMGSGGGGGGYGHQEMRSPDGFNQYEPTWQQQNQASMKTNWPYCETCDQSFPTVGLLSQHCNSSSHMEMKLMKQQSHHQQQQQQQYHSGGGGPSQQGMSDQSRFYQGTTGGGHGGRGGMQASNQGQYYGNQGAGGQQDHYRGTNTQNQGGHYNTQNQGGHYAAKEWRPFNRNSQFLS